MIKENCLLLLQFATMQNLSQSINDYSATIVFYYGLISDYKITGESCVPVGAPLGVQDRCKCNASMAAECSGRRQLAPPTSQFACQAETTQHPHTPQSSRLSE